MKKILFSSLTIVAVVAITGVTTWALWSDTETSEANVFTAGSIDLTVDGQDDPNVGVKFSADHMQPGNVYNGGCTTLKNVGSVDGKLSVKVSNLVSNENTLIEPELSDGDIVSTEIDPDGYHGNTGDGELWDQITMQMCLDDGTGSWGGDGKCSTGVQETIFKGFGSTQDDYSSLYSIKQDFDYADGKNVVLTPNEEVTFCMDAKFIDDATNSWWGGQGNLTNNMAMTDDAQLDVEFGLNQITTP